MDGILSHWWLWLAGGLVSGLAAGAFAMVSLSASTAYGTEYHNMSPAQRRMARVLYLGSFAAGVLCGLLSLALFAWGVRLFIA